MARREGDSLTGDLLAGAATVAAGFAEGAVRGTASPPQSVRWQVRLEGHDRARLPSAP